MRLIGRSADHGWAALQAFSHTRIALGRAGTIGICCTSCRHAAAIAGGQGDAGHQRRRKEMRSLFVSFLSVRYSTVSKKRTKDAAGLALVSMSSPRPPSSRILPRSEGRCSGLADDANVVGRTITIEIELRNNNSRHSAAFEEFQSELRADQTAGAHGHETDSWE
jgi:hypothetical protein